MKMEFNRDVLINFAPIFFTFIFTLAVLLTVFHKLKIRWPVRANCWFCNQDASIWRHNVDWWLCPNCKQYNGFSKDGDYKYPIREQRKMPKFAKFYISQHASNSFNSKNFLCTDCNNNEELKLLELRKFDGICSKRSEIEIQKFKCTLEKKFPLCSKCKQLVNDVLYKQTLWLARYKMMFFKQKPIKALINSGYQIEKILRILLIIIDCVIIYNSAFWPLTILGVILQLRIFFIKSKCGKQQDIWLAILWICMCILSTFREFNVIKTDYKTWWIPQEYITRHYFIAALGTIIGFLNIRTKSYKIVTKNVSFKKLNTSANSTELEASSSLSTPSSKISSVENLNRDRNHDNTFHPPVNVTNLLMNCGSWETEMPIRSTQILKDNRSHSTQFSLPKNSHNFSFSVTKNCDENYSNQRESFSLNDSLHNLSTLSLSQVDSEKLVKTTNIFETKVYNTSTSGLFSKYNKTNKKSILAPSKLKSVTQGSWVAAGYWQTGMEPSSLSRSSSQSSGFGSVSSNLEPSREPSVYNEFDQCSTVSDTTQCCCSSRRNSKISFNSDSCSNSLFTRPANPICNQLLRLEHNQTSLNSTLPSVQLQLNKPSVSDQYTKNSECLIRHLQQVPIYTGHTTVVTNLVWLPALLCTSLVVNIIVLCTVLMH